MQYLFLLCIFLLAPLVLLHCAQDVAELRSDAEQGDAKAQFGLGELYYKGQGVTQDYVEARKWYLKATEQGHAEAQFNLGVLYDHGQGVPQDYVTAYAWFNLAAAQGADNAKKARDIVAEKLDTASLARAQTLSNEYFKIYVEPFQYHLDPW